MCVPIITTSGHKKASNDHAANCFKRVLTQEDRIGHQQEFVATGGCVMMEKSHKNGEACLPGKDAPTLS